MQNLLMVGAKYFPSVKYTEVQITAQFIGNR